MVKKQMEVSVRLFGLELKAYYVIPNWVQKFREVEEVHGAEAEFLDSDQTLRAYHTTHGAFRRLCAQEIEQAARKVHPAVMEKVEVRDEETGDVTTVEKETTESRERYEAYAKEIAPGIIQTLNGKELPFGRGLRGPTKSDFEKAEEALALFTEQPEIYAKVRDAAKRFKLKLSDTPEVKELAEYLRAVAREEAAAQKANPLAAFKV